MSKRIAPKPEAFIPAGKRLLVLPEESSNLSQGGILMPETTKERPQVGTIISIGEEVTKYKPGNHVLYGKSAGIKIEFEVGVDSDGDAEYREYWLMQESELFGTL